MLHVMWCGVCGVLCCGHVQEGSYEHGAGNGLLGMTRLPSDGLSSVVKAEGLITPSMLDSQIALFIL